MFGLNNKIIKESELENECGVTIISLKRALYLKQEGWEPFQIVIFGEDTSNVNIDIQFRNEKIRQSKFYTFTGFSIGYGGTGPRGFEEFLKLFNIELPLFNPITCDIKNGPYWFFKYKDGWKKDR